MFLYKNFYQTIAQSEEVVLLKKEVAPDAINMNKVNAVLGALDQKTAMTDSVDFTGIKNPFDFSSLKAAETPLPLQETPEE
jgi:hypothetical protein